MASFETATGGFSGRLHLRNLPAVAGTQITNGGSLPLTTVTAASYDSAELAAPASTVTITATQGGVPFRADIAPRAFSADVTSADGSTAIRVHGADPNGGPVAIDLLAAAGGSTLASVSAPARIGSGLDVTAALPFAARGARSPS